VVVSLFVTYADAFILSVRVFFLFLILSRDSSAILYPSTDKLWNVCGEQKKFTTHKQTQTDILEWRQTFMPMCTSIKHSFIFVCTPVFVFIFCSITCMHGIKNIYYYVHASLKHSFKTVRARLVLIAIIGHT
jgi:hypothetical protein